MIDKKHSIPTEIIEGDIDCSSPVSVSLCGRPHEPAYRRIHGAAATFRGNLIVKGNIGDSCTIQAERNIQVDGCVGASVIRAGGNILVKKGVFGRGCLDACGDIEVDCVENGNLISGGNITIHQGATHSRLAADKEIILPDGKGVLAGGKAKASIAITAKRIGSPHITPTLLEVGIPPLLRDEHQRLKEKIESLRKQVDQVEKAVIHIEKLSTDSNNSSDSRVRKLPLWMLRVAYFSEELEKYIKRFETLERILSAPNAVMKGNPPSPKGGTADGSESAVFYQGGFQHIESRVNVEEEIYPGVKISIAWTALEITEILRGVTFFARDGKIQWESLIESS